MNNLFKVVWNKNRQEWQAVSECASSNGKATKASSSSRQGASFSLKNILSQFAAGSLLIITLPSIAFANNLPTGGQVQAGAGQINSSGQTMTINQASQNMVVDWQSFSIGKDASVNFVQPNAQAAALNRVLGDQVSNIRGAINANGQVFLVNPNGILFSPTARVDVGSLVSSTLNISNENFMNGNYRFEGNSSNAVINQGNIQTLNGGTVALIAAKIINTGSITTPKGNILMGAGNKVILDLGGPVKIEVGASELETYIEQGGAIKADGGMVYLTAKAANALTSSVINHTGITQAQTLASGENGTIMLMGDMQSGTVQVAGTLDASAANKGDGGFIETSAAKVQISDAKITTLANNGKTGEWLIDPVNITIAATGGNITGAALATALQTNNVTLDTSATGSCTGATCDTLTGTAGNIFVNDDIKVTSGNTDTTLTLKANRSITIDENKEISSTSGKLDVVFWARAGGNADASDGSDGNVWLKTGSSVNTNGGNITIGGGTDPLNNYARGVNISGSQTRGVTLQGSLDAAGGNISIRGRGRQISSRGVSVEGDISTSGNGTIDIHGIAVGSSDAVGIGNNITVGTGTIFITGKKDYAGGNAININNASNITSQGLVVLDGATGSEGNITADSTSTIKAKNLLVLNSDTVDLKSATNDIETLGATNVGAIAIADANSITLGSVDWKDTSYKGIQASGKLELLYGQDSAASGNTSDYSINAPVDLTAGQNFSTKLGSDGAVVAWTVVTDATAMQAMTLEDSNQNYALGNNITLTGTNNWTPIGVKFDNAFKGNFDGLGHTISNLHINKNDNNPNGLFGYITGSAIKNIGVLNVNISGKNYVGGLIGSATDTTIKNTYSTGVVSATEGFSAYIGGLIGWNSNSSIKNSYSTSEVNGPSMAGGLVGKNYQSNIENSYATGKVTGVNDIGGLIGENSGDIKNSYATGDVTGTGSQIGGLAGSHFNKNIANSYATGKVTGSSDVGGLVGKNGSGTITNSFYDKETNTAVMGDNATYGKTKAEILTAFSDKTGWSTGGGADVEGYEIAELPYLTDVTRDIDKSFTTLFAGGMGVDGNAYTITNWTQLQNINNANILTKDHFFSLLNDLGATTAGYTIQVKNGATLANDGKGWNPIGYFKNMSDQSLFAGNFDGLGHTVKDLFINRPDDQFNGLFAYINNSTIKNIGVINANIQSNNIFGGVLAGGVLNSTIENAYSTGTLNISVNDNDWGTAAGGLVGILNSSTINNSYSTVKTTGISKIGGLVGYLFNSSTINNSYATGEVTGTGNNVGGLVGYNGSGTITNSFWDAQTSGQANSAGGVGKTTAKMQDKATFVDWGIAEDSTLPSTYLYPVLVTDAAGVTSWKIAKAITSIKYTLSDVINNYIYNGTSQLPTEWLSSAIFGNDYSSWKLGTDYKLVHNAAAVTGFKDAGIYTNISVEVLKTGFVIDSTSKNGKFIIASRPITVTADSFNKNEYTSDPTFTFKTSCGSLSSNCGLVTGESLSGTLSREAGEVAGNYAIQQGSVNDPNYAITFEAGKLTIAAIDVTPTPEPIEPPWFPEPVIPEPVIPEPVIPEPVIPEPVVPEPVVPEPIAPVVNPVEQIIAGIQQQPSNVFTPTPRSTTTPTAAAQSRLQQLGSLELVEGDELTGDQLAGLSVNNSALIKIFVIQGGLNLGNFNDNEQ